MSESKPYLYFQTPDKYSTKTTLSSRSHLHIYRETQKNGNFWKTQQKLKKSNKKILLIEIEPLQLAF